MNVRRKLMGFCLGWLMLLVASPALFAQGPWLAVNGTEHDYLTLNYYIDEDQGDSETILLEFWPNDGAVTQAQIWSNLGRRDLATLDDQDWASIPGPQPAGNSYFVGYPMQDMGDGKWQLELPIDKTGAYRLTARYQKSGASEWSWAGKRDTAIMVSPKKARDVILYELMVNVINATGDTEGTRSTFEDLMNPGKPANLDYFQDIGVNTLWIQPIHPVGDHACVDKSAGPGSPYSIQNMWEVAPHMGQGNTRSAAMAAFTNFAAEAKARNIDFFFDIIFNHTSWDAEIGRDPANPHQAASNPTALIKDVLPGWYSRYVGSLGTCDPSPSAWNQADFHFEYPARNAGELGPAPAERIDFGKWPDVAALYWGTYPALFDPHTDTDAYWDVGAVGADVKRMTEYFAYFGQYWIEKSGGTLGGFRCDYAQGIPPQAWEYIVNKTRQFKWDFIFMAESLDGGNVSKRAGRHMDIINQNWVWQVLENGHSTTGFRGIIDANKTDYGYAGIMRGIINHDQNAPDNKWWSFSSYAVGAVVDGAPQMYQGQELGYVNGWGFSQFRVEHDRAIPHIFKWHNMQTLWNNTDAVLQNAYSRVNRARQRSRPTRLHDQWYLDRTAGEGPHQYIFSVLKYDNFGWDPAHQEVVLNFVNLQPWTAHSATFDLAAVDAIYINPERTYNVRNLMADNPVDLWGTGRTGQQIINDGVSVSFSADGNANPDSAFVQVLRLYEQGNWPSGPGVATVDPAVPDGCVSVAITYDPADGPLAAASTVAIHMGHNGFQDVTTVAMSQAGHLWTASYQIPPETAELNFVFRNHLDSEQATAWDNNDGDNWNVTVLNCDTPQPVELAITTPTSDITVPNATATYTLQGSASGLIGNLLWTNALTQASGTIPVTSPWSIADVSLAVGENAITVHGFGEIGTEITIATDAASNYTEGTWTNGANRGSGLNPWVLYSEGSAGTFLDTDANRWGLWSHGGENLAEIVRPFPSALQAGQTFRTRMQNGWIWEEGGSIGVSLRNSENATLWELYFNGGATHYTGTDGQTDVGWTDAGVDIAFTLTGPNAYSVAVQPIGGSVSTYTGTFSGSIANFRAWSSGNGADDGQNHNRNFYVHNLAITEPGGGTPATSVTVRITRQAGDKVLPQWFLDEFYGGVPQDPDAINASGMSNWASLMAGLDPGNPNATFTLDTSAQAGNGQITVSWPAARTDPLTRSYSIWRSTDLTQPNGGFVLLQGNITGTTQFTDDDPPEGKVFYRAGVVAE